MSRSCVPQMLARPAVQNGSQSGRPALLPSAQGRCAAWLERARAQGKRLGRPATQPAGGPLQFVDWYARFMEPRLAEGEKRPIRGVA
jgi:hypothetical protein